MAALLLAFSIAAPCWPRRGPAPRWRVVRLASSQAQPLQEEHPRLPRQSRRKKRGSSAREGFSWESCSPLFVAAKHKPDLVPVFNNHIRSCSTTQFSFTPLTGPSWEKVFFFLSHFLFLKCCTPLENILSNPFHHTTGRFPQHF